jgi:hypothetical protein
MTLLAVPVFDTATNKPFSCDQQMLVHALSAADVPTVHVDPPLVEYIVRLPTPLWPTATNKLSLGAKQMADQVLLALTDPCPQATPSRDWLVVVLRLLIPAMEPMLESQAIAVTLPPAGRVVSEKAPGITLLGRYTLDIQ